MPGQSVRDTYEVERLLGKGVFGEVYHVKHRFKGRQAMKVFKVSNATLQDIERDIAETLLLANGREKAQRLKSLMAGAALSRIDDEQLVDQVDSLMDAASQDQDALAQLDRRLRDLTVAVDEVEVDLGAARATNRSAMRSVERKQGRAEP